MTQMDDVDQKQQQEIEALQKKDEFHDFWLKVLAIGVVGWVLISTSIMMVKMTNYQPSLSCPHKDCTHYHA